jgi:ketosteroid isomerase-like protein
MRRVVFIGLALAILPSTAETQQLTPEQQEVWDVVESCWDAAVRDDVETLLSCFHEDYSFWWAEDVLPFGKEFVGRIVPIALPVEDLAVVDVRPAQIVVRGDVAITQWGVRWFERTQDGTLAPTVERISMTLIRENERWSYLGGGGSPVR